MVGTWRRLSSYSRIIGVLAVVVTLIVLGIGHMAAPTLAASFTAQDQSITTIDGTVSSVSVAPEMAISWDGLDSDLSYVRVTIAASADGSTWEPVAGENYLPEASEERSGNAVLMFTEANLLKSEDYYSGTAAFTPSDFHATEGATKETTVYLLIGVSAIDTNGDVIHSNQQETEFVVTVTNQAITITSEGTANTGVTA